MITVHIITYYPIHTSSYTTHTTHIIHTSHIAHTSYETHYTHTIPVPSIIPSSHHLGQTPSDLNIQVHSPTPTMAPTIPAGLLLSGQTKELGKEAGWRIYSAEVQGREGIGGIGGIGGQREEGGEGLLTVVASRRLPLGADTRETDSEARQVVRALEAVGVDDAPQGIWIDLSPQAHDQTNREVLQIVRSLRSRLEGGKGRGVEEELRALRTLLSPSEGRGLEGETVYKASIVQVLFSLLPIPSSSSTSPSSSSFPHFFPSPPEPATEEDKTKETESIIQSILHTLLPTASQAQPTLIHILTHLRLSLFRFLVPPDLTEQGNPRMTVLRADAADCTVHTSRWRSHPNIHHLLHHATTYLLDFPSSDPQRAREERRVSRRDGSDGTARETWHLLFPPIMTYVYDFEPPTQLIGCHLLTHLLSLVPPSIIQQKSLVPLIRPRLILLANNLASPDLLRAALAALDALPDHTVDSDFALFHSVITNIWIYKSQDPVILTISLQYLPRIFHRLQRFSARFLKPVIGQCLEILHTPLLRDEDGACRSQAMDVIQYLCCLLPDRLRLRHEHASPDTPASSDPDAVVRVGGAWTEEMLYGLAKAWVISSDKGQYRSC